MRYFPNVRNSTHPSIDKLFHHNGSLYNNLCKSVRDHRYLYSLYVDMHSYYLVSILTNTFFMYILSRYNLIFNPTYTHRKLLVVSQHSPPYSLSMTLLSKTSPRFVAGPPHPRSCHERGEQVSLLCLTSSPETMIRLYSNVPYIYQGNDYVHMQCNWNSLSYFPVSSSISISRILEHLVTSSLAFYFEL